MSAIGRMMGRNRKRSRIAFTPFSACPCCDGPTIKGRAAEAREWRAELHDLDDVADEFGVDISPEGWAGHPANLSPCAKASCLAGGCEWGDPARVECECPR